MDNEVKKEKLKFLQSFFVRSFVVSFLLMILATVMCIVMHDVQLAFVNKYFPMPVEKYNYLVILLFGFWKILVFQFTLIPAIVIWSIRKCCCSCGCECENK